MKIQFRPIALDFFCEFSQKGNILVAGPCVATLLRYTHFIYKSPRKLFYSQTAKKKIFRVCFLREKNNSCYSHLLFRSTWTHFSGLPGGEEVEGAKAKGHKININNAQKYMMCPLYTNTGRRILAAKLFGDDRSGGWRHFEVEETQLGDGGGGGGGGGGFKIDFRLRVRETNSDK